MWQVVYMVLDLWFLYFLDLADPVCAADQVIVCDFFREVEEGFLEGGDEVLAVLTLFDDDLDDFVCVEWVKSGVDFVENAEGSGLAFLDG